MKKVIINEITIDVKKGGNRLYDVRGIGDGDKFVTYNKVDNSTIVCGDDKSKVYNRRLKVIEKAMEGVNIDNMTRKAIDIFVENYLSLQYAPHKVIVCRYATKDGDISLSIDKDFVCINVMVDNINVQLFLSHQYFDEMMEQIVDSMTLPSDNKEGVELDEIHEFFDGSKAYNFFLNGYPCKICVGMDNKIVYTRYNKHVQKFDKKLVNRTLIKAFVSGVHELSISNLKTIIYAVAKSRIVMTLHKLIDNNLLKQSYSYYFSQVDNDYCQLIKEIRSKSDDLANIILRQILEYKQVKRLAL